MLNVLPSSIASQLERLEKAIACWPIQFSIDHAIKWVLQFDSDDYLLALRIIESLDVLAQRDVRSAFEVAQAKLERAAVEKGAPIKGNNTLYAGVGQAAKSGAVMAYHYRLTAKIAEGDFFFRDDEDEIDFSKIDNIVLLDDVIGTGKSVITDITSISEQVHSLSKTRNIYVLTVAGYADGIIEVVKETGASVISALEYSSKDTVKDLDAAFYSNMPMSERNRTLERIKRYCRITSRSALGYGDVGGLLVFDHNTPNTTLPLIWAIGNGWIPLFPRAGRIQGAAKVLKVVEEERKSEAQQKEKSPPQKDSIEITLFVEGKFDEIFVDVMRNRMDFAKKIGVKDVTAVALGGLTHSARLIDLLRESRKFSIFILDGDAFSQKLASLINSNESTGIIYLKPTFSALFDFSKVFADEGRFRGLPDPNGNPSNEGWMRDFEIAVIKRGNVSSNSERIAQVIEEYLDKEKYEEFTQEVSNMVDKLIIKSGPDI